MIWTCPRRKPTELSHPLSFWDKNVTMEVGMIARIKTNHSTGLLTSFLCLLWVHREVVELKWHNVSNVTTTSWHTPIFRLVPSQSSLRQLLMPSLNYTIPKSRTQLTLCSKHSSRCMTKYSMVHLSLRPISHITHSTWEISQRSSRALLLRTKSLFLC